MITLLCPDCSETVHAPEELVGGTHKCPKCGATMRRQDRPGPRSPPSTGEIPETSAAFVTPQQASGILAVEHNVPYLHHGPDHLDRQSHYLICDKTHLVAAWGNDGRGWMLRTSAGMVSAHRNLDKLPSQGDFKLVELKLAETDAGFRLEHIVVYQLAGHWGLTRIEKGDDKILGAIVGLAGLSKEQKDVVRDAIRGQFMRSVWENAAKVVEFLGNTDYHSPGT